MRLVREVNAPRCDCPLCRMGQARRDLDAATDAWLDGSEEQSMALAYLRDEVRAVAGSWRGFLVRGRLRGALTVSDASVAHALRPR